MPITKAVYPGSFDPVTNGHIDIIMRGRRIFDEIVVALVHNPSKTYLFSVEQRLEMLEKSFSGVENVSFDFFDGLLVDYVDQTDANVVVRGIRAVTDFEFELQMALMNKRLSRNFETVFLMPREEHIFVSSRLVKEIARLDGDVSSMVHPFVLEQLKLAFGE